MKKLKVKEKLKKLVLIVITFVMIAFMMPTKSNAGIICDFIDLLLKIPDGAMAIIDRCIGQDKNFTIKEINLAGWGAKGAIYNFEVTPYKIFTSGTYVDDGFGNYYTNLGLFDINFFSDRKIVTGSDNEGLVSSQILAPVIGNVYVSLRNLALVLMMLVVLYIGIKIMISSIAAQQAKYKQLLVDWLVGFALLFMMHYIMSGIVSLNSIVVNLLSNDEGDSYYVGIAELDESLFTWDWEHPFKSIGKSAAGVRDKAGKGLVHGINGVAKFFGFKGFGENSQEPDSKWYRIMSGGGEDDFSDEKYTEFLANNVIVRNSEARDGTFSMCTSENHDHVDTNGRLDLKKVHRGSGADLNFGYIYGSEEFHKKLKEMDEVIYLSASIYKSDKEEYRNKAILKFNTMSYARTVSSFALNDEENIVFYDKDGESPASDVDAMGYSILYLVLVIETIMFAFTYLKRVLQMSFLTMVAPIVAIMYPVDKIGDGKAQAFNTWFKDYLFNVLIQPMHLLLYTIFIVAASELTSRNIIYALGVYGFMIPSEKYFKKILGFEKGGSNAGGGPMSNAIGRGLAMDGLGKLAGIGPAARRGGGGSGGSGKKTKVGKNTPSDPNGLNPLGGGNSDTGNGGGNTFNGVRRANNGRYINPKAAPGSKQGLIKSALMTGGNRIMRAATGGKYDNLHRVAGDFRSANGLGKAAVVAKLAGDGLLNVGKGAGRIGSMAVAGGIGLMAGTATAMTTGDVSNIWKGTAVGAGAGNKLYGRAEDALSAFSDEVKAERAANDEDYNKKYQYKMNQELNKEDMDALLPDEQKDVDEMMHKYSGVTGRASVDEFKALKEIEKKANSSVDPNMHINENNTQSGMNALKYAKRFQNTIFTDPDKVKRALSKDYGYDSSIAPGDTDNDAAKANVDMMMELIHAGAKKLK